jgi:collagenase-like PrtC family protease
MTLDSMKAVSRSRHEPDMDFEVFILNTLCVYIDGFCTFLHTYGGQCREGISQKGWAKDDKIDFVQAYDTEAVSDACALKYSVETFDPSLRKRIKNKTIQPTFFKQLIDGVECGACALYDISRTNVGFLKIVGRQLIPEVRINSTKFIRGALDILHENKNIRKEDFIKRTQQLYQHAFRYKQKCRGNNCYHPEVLS